MNLTESLGYAAAFLVLLTFSMRTMIPLRVVGIASNIFFLAYAYLSGAHPILILHAILLPLNIFRLVQILTLLRKIEQAARADGEPDLLWMQSIAKNRATKAGEILFRRGELAESLFYVVSGSFRAKEIGVDLGAGELIGELGLLAPNKARTQTIECTADAEILELSYGYVKQFYFQSPKFGFYFLQLAGRRLFENLERQDRELAAYRAAAAKTG